MSSIFTNLLFMHGHITDLELARRLAQTSQPASGPGGKRKRTHAALRKAVDGAGATAPGNAGLVVTALRWATAR